MYLYICMFISGISGIAMRFPWLWVNVAGRVGDVFLSVCGRVREIPLQNAVLFYCGYIFLEKNLN